MPTEKDKDLDIWCSTGIICPRLIHEPILRLATGNCLIGFYADKPPTEIVASLLRCRKLWTFATPESKEAANYFKCFFEDMIYQRTEIYVIASRSPMILSVSLLVLYISYSIRLLMVVGTVCSVITSYTVEERQVKCNGWLSTTTVTSEVVQN